MTVTYDLVVLGGGPGGYVAAIKASQLGLKVALIEKNKVGGTCLHYGCIPSKSLLKSAQAFRDIKTAHTFGITGIDHDGLKVDMAVVNERKDTVVSQLHNGVTHLLKKADIDVYKGIGRILGPSIFSPISGTISVEYEDGRENTLITPKFVLIATGSTERKLQDIPTDGTHILSTSDTLNLRQLPSSAIIVGGGVIGIEFASMLQDLGVDITVIEANDTILEQEDEDIRAEVEAALTKRGVSFIKNAIIDATSIEKENGISLDVKYGEKIHKLKADKLILAVGRQANIDNIGLENTTIKVEHGVIKTNDMYQTAESHIYAIGDCIGGAELAHVASKEAMIAVEHMANKDPLTLNPLNIPSCIYSYPETSRIGLTEGAAREQGLDIKIGKFPFSHIGKALINDELDGFIKIIADKKTDDILGIHMVGSHVTELISEASLATLLDATAWEIGQAIHPHPSLSETLMEAGLAVDGEQIHL